MTWLAIEGIFRQELGAQAVNLTLGHFDGLAKDFGFPVFPETFDSTDEEFRPWGDQCLRADSAVWSSQIRMAP